jgi:hypothetical protein
MMACGCRCHQPAGGGEECGFGVAGGGGAFEAAEAKAAEEAVEVEVRAEVERAS